MDFNRDGDQIGAYGRGSLAEELRADGRRDGAHIDGYDWGKFRHFWLVLCIGPHLLASIAGVSSVRI